MLLFTLRKIVSRLVFPTSALLLSLIAGIVLLLISQRRKKPRLGAAGLAIICAATGGLYLASLNPVADLFLWSLEGRYAPLPAPANASRPQDIPQDIPIVVLGAGHHERVGHGALHSLSRAARARVVEGVRLSAQLPHAQLIFTGGQIGGERAIADVAADAAVELGLEPRRITRLSNPLDTAAEARAVAAALNPASNPARPRIILVTSASHMHRARAEFHAAGIDTIAAPAEYLAASRRYSPWSLIPSAGALEKFERAAYEYLGLLAARLRGVRPSAARPAP